MQCFNTSVKKLMVEINGNICWPSRSSIASPPNKLRQSQPYFKTEHPNLAKWLLRLYQFFTSSAQRTHEKFCVLTITLTPPRSRNPCSFLNLKAFGETAKVAFQDGFSFVLPYVWQLSYHWNIDAWRSTKCCWKTESLAQSSITCVSASPGFAVPEITTRNTIVATRWFISLYATTNPDRHVFILLVSFGLMTTCHIWNMTDVGIQQPSKTSKEVNEVRSVGNITASLDQVIWLEK